MDITVVIPAYKAEKTIARALESVTGQSARVGVVVVVDGSFDRTAEVAGAFEGVTVLVNETNRGAVKARNRGLECVTTPLVAFMDADDYVEDDLHLGMVRALDRDAADLVVSAWSVEHALRRDRRIAQPVPPPGDNAALVGFMMRSGTIQTGALGWRTDRLKAIGGWDERLRKGQDFEIALRSAIRGLKWTTNAVGRSIHVNHASPDRLYWVSTAALAADYLRVMHEAEAFAAGRQDLLQAIGARHYELASRCYREGAAAEGAIFLAEARRLGHRGHAGTLAHRAACALVGLRGKQLFARNIAALRRRLGRAAAISAPPPR